MIFFLVVGLVVLAGLVVGAVLARRRSAALPIEERCEVCGVWLTTKTAVVLAAGFSDDIDEAQGHGGTGMTAYYCHRDAP